MQLQESCEENCSCENQIGEKTTKKNALIFKLLQSGIRSMASFSYAVWNPDVYHFARARLQFNFRHLGGAQTNCSLRAFATSGILSWQNLFKSLVTF